MAQSIQAVRGISDILPEETAYWQLLESQLSRIVASYGYQEIRLPVIEQTALFARSIGEVTDIVAKEMYTFVDRNGDSLSLRPEGTAGCVRACLQRGLLHRQTPRLWYLGPMFRRERPQKGRYRQFYQLGVEAFALAGPEIDAELILMSARFWQALGLADTITLQLNSLGSLSTRKQYQQALVAYFQEYRSDLDEEHRHRLQTNPLRLLDSKMPAVQTLIAQAPKMTDYLDEASSAHFARLRAYLEAAGVAYEINPTLVRGLDYYTDTVFEWVSSDLGAQGTVCAGGRYDGLVELSGGPATPAVGFALGIERLALLYKQHSADKPHKQNLDIYVVAAGDKGQQQGYLLAEQIRDALPQLRIISHCGDDKFKSQFKKADKSGARIALIMGDDEAAQGNVGIKYLREDRAQETVAQKALFTVLGQVF